MNIKQIGNDFEKEFAVWLAKKGMFVYNLPNKTNGQPFDILAAKDNVFFAFECKHCNKDYFPLSRVEDNQIQALEKMKATGNKWHYFVFKFKDEIKYCPAKHIQLALKNNEKRIHKERLIPIDILEVFLSI